MDSNTVQVICEMVFTGQKTQPTVAKYWRKNQKRQTTKYTYCIYTPIHIERNTYKHNKSPSLY